MTNGTMQEQPRIQVDLPMIGGEAAQTLMGADPRAGLVKGIERAIVQFDEDALAEIAFLPQYCGREWADDFLERTMRWKYHQSPGALGRLIEALKALSLYEYMQKVNLNFGGGK